MGVYKHISKIALIIIWFVAMMILLSFVGTLLTVPSTFANILGVIVIIILIFASAWFFKLVNKIDKEEQSTNN